MACRISEKVMMESDVDSSSRKNGKWEQAVWCAQLLGGSTMSDCISHVHWFTIVVAEQWWRGSWESKKNSANGPHGPSANRKETYVGQTTEHT